MADKVKREMLGTARAILEPEGFTVTYEPGGKHPKLVVERDGRRAWMTAPTSMRTDNHVRYTRQKAERLLRDWDTDARAA